MAVFILHHVMGNLYFFDGKQVPIVRSILLGIGLGVIAILVSTLLRPITLYRHLIDPLQLVQPLLNLRFGLLNFNPNLMINHLLYLTGLALLITFFTRFFKIKERDGVIWTARAVGLTTLAYIFWLRVDAFVLVLWYGLSGYASLALLVWLSKRFDQILYINQTTHSS